MSITTGHTQQISLKSAAIAGGVATLVMTVCAPFSELFAYPKLVVAGNGAETLKNIIAHPALFSELIMGYLVTFTCDIIAAWAFYILMRPVNKHLSALTAIFRLLFATIAIVSLLNLANAYRLTMETGHLKLLDDDHLKTQVMLFINSFRYDFHFGTLFFGIHLCLLGYLVFISKYIPKVLGILIIISGVGYIATALQPYLFPQLNMSLAIFTFFGELIFMLWLLIRGWRIKEL